MQNVVTVVFNVESEAYKAFSELRAQPIGEGYNVAEASLIKREGDAIKVVDGFDAAGTSGDDTAAGMVIGAFVGILGGPLGVLLGAGVGSLIGNAKDARDADDSLSMTARLPSWLWFRRRSPHSTLRSPRMRPPSIVSSLPT